jgi:glycosyltransferase involved in cell wall biosynthesis
VLASLSEGLPVVIMEALALHRPVICTAVGGVAELVTPGSSGWLVAPGSERELADAMQQALSRPVEELERMARAGARRVVAAHDSRVQARTMAELFIASSAAPLAAARPAIP